MFSRKDSICQVFEDSEEKRIKMDSRTCNFEYLPLGILSQIFHLCDSVSLVNLGLVSNRFNQIIRGNSNQNLIEHLPSEILLKFFTYLDTRSIGRLSQVSRRFSELGRAECLWIRSAKNAIVTSSIRPDVRQRSIKQLPARDKVRIAHNWTSGIYAEANMIVQDLRYMPRVQLERDILWVSWGNRIWAHPRQTDGTIRRATTRVLKGHADDVSRFVVRDGILVSGGRDSAMLGWDSATGEFLFAKRYCHSGEVSSVDISSRHQLVLSGSRDRLVKLWNLSCNNQENNQNHNNMNIQPSFPSLIETINIGDRIWSLSTSLDGTVAVIGSAGLGGVPAIHTLDLNRASEPEPYGTGLLKKGAGTLDITWYSDNSFITCGYDASSRLWDTRTGNCVRVWEDPFNESVYCLSTDNHNTLVCGTSRHGLVRLWDMRFKKPLQMYYAKHPRRGQSSPVYSVAFDPSNLYVALDQSLNLLSFAGLNNQENKRKFRRI